MKLYLALGLLCLCLPACLSAGSYCRKGLKAPVEKPRPTTKPPENNEASNTEPPPPPPPFCDDSQADNFRKELDEQMKLYDSEYNVVFFLECLNSDGYMVKDSLQTCGINVTSARIIIYTMEDSTTSKEYCCVVTEDAKKDPLLKDVSKRNEILKKCMDKLFDSPVCDASDGEAARELLKSQCTNEKLLNPGKQEEFSQCLEEKSVLTKSHRQRCDDLTDRRYVNLGDMYGDICSDKKYDWKDFDKYFGCSCYLDLQDDPSVNFQEAIKKCKKAFLTE